MKKLLLAALIIFTLTATAQAANLKKIGNTGDAAITSGQGWLRSVIINTDGTNSVTLAIYDNGSAASGSKIISDIVVTTSSGNRATSISFADREAAYWNGIYIDVTTSGSVTYDAFFESN